MRHKYTTERIFHFTCGKCSQWWSYASSEDGAMPDYYEMNCPHCGSLGIVDKKSYIEPKEEVS